MLLSLSIEKACAQSGIGKTRLYDAINQGHLKARKFGKRTLILQQDLQEFLANLEMYPTVVGGSK